MEAVLLYCVRGGSCLASRLHPYSWLQNLSHWGSQVSQFFKTVLSCPCEFAHLQMERRLSLKTLTHPQGLCSVGLQTHISLMVTKTLWHCYDSEFLDLPVANSLSVTLQSSNPVVMVCTESHCRSFFLHANQLSRS